MEVRFLSHVGCYISLLIYLLPLHLIKLFHSPFFGEYSAVRLIGQRTVGLMVLMLKTPHFYTLQLN